MVRQAVTYRASSDDLRPLRTFPLASRVELSELRLNDSWRFGDESEEIRGYQPEFESLFNELYGIDGCNLTSYFDEAQVPYVPYYSFGERVAVRSEESATVRLSRSYGLLADMIQSPSPAWEFARADRDKPEGPDSETLPAVPWDMEWASFHRKRALQGLSSARRTSFMEIRFSLSRAKVSTSRRQLLEAGQAAELGTRAVNGHSTFHPEPSTDGIFQSVFNASDGVYDYWTLRENGDFFRVRSLPENGPTTGTVHVVDIVYSIARALLFCQRLYSRLGVTPRAEVQFAVGISGIKDRELTIPDKRGPGYYKRTTRFDEVQREIKLVVGRTDSDLVHYVKSLAEPLLEIFEFTLLADDEYEEMVRQVLAATDPQFRSPTG
jgi:hypothetical protein